MKKKILAFMLATFLIVSLAACGRDATTTQGGEEKSGVQAANPTQDPIPEEKGASYEKPIKMFVHTQTVLEQRGYKL